MYPKARKSELVEDHHGTKVADPYRWLEDLDSEETRTWVEEQSALTFDYLSKIPGREKIRRRLTALWDYEKFGMVSRPDAGVFAVENRYFIFKNDGLQNHHVLYVMESLDGEPRPLLDPNTWSSDGTVALSGLSVSDDAELALYGVSQAGSDWQEWRIVDVTSGRQLEDHLKWIKFSHPAWLKDGSGFFYSRYAERDAEPDLQAINQFQKLYFHRVGTFQGDDELVYERPDQKEWGFHPDVTEDGGWLVITVWKGTHPENGVFIKSLTDADAQVVELLHEFDASYVYLGSDGPVFYFQTNRDAPRERIVAIDVRSPEPSKWQEIVPEADPTLETSTLVGGRFFARYLKDAHSEVSVFRLDGTLEREIDLPGVGSVVGLSGRPKGKDTFYLFTSFMHPGTVFHYDIETGVSSVFKEPEVSFRSDDFVTKQVFYQSKDGTRVPMFINHRTDLEINAKTPTTLYGYGGFSIAMTPVFSVANLMWMEMGGIHAVACIRGGGEYGEVWHQAGAKLNRQNVFDDFIAAGEWLISNGYTSTPHLGIHGGSNGGLLCGASITQKPGLFGAAHIAVGVLDMLRFHKFTIGWAWTSDYGSPDDPAEFKVLYSYSPLHNLKAGTRYPAVLITTGDHDDRVWPGHSFKFAAALQEAQEGDAPNLIRIETRAGHGLGKPTYMIIDELADARAFLAHHLGLHA